MIKNLLLDYNGVISNDFELVYVTTMEVLKKFRGKVISKNEFKKEFTIPINGFYKKYLPNVPMEKHSKYYFKIYKKIGKPEIFKDVKETLEALYKNDIILVIISAHEEKYINSELLEFGINPTIFRNIYGNVTNKEIFLKRLIKAKQFKKQETAYVGDTEYDILLSKKMKILSIASIYGYRDRLSLLKCKPDFFISNFGELMKIMRDMI